MRVGQPNLIKTNCFPGNAECPALSHTASFGNDHCFAGLSSVFNTTVARSCHWLCQRGQNGDRRPLFMTWEWWLSLSMILLAHWNHSLPSLPNTKKEQDGFYYKGKLQRITPNKQGSWAGIGQIWRRWMISGVNISTWEQPQKEACRATEGAIVLIMQALVRVVFLCRLRDLVDKTVRYIYL